ncbi:MAG: DNA mismatch repair endonuclease MutL [Muribaculaceae bacterium]|nr:DNA mismatch repair endonuclease MutL [Muribaculaceae bacterium]
MNNQDVIKLLPDSVANQIAAGEVIQRPASVIKELVENAVDAGAQSITIILKDAGRTLIQVVDDGCGMSPSDARMAFERHATSKISAATDLYALHTMGFRGEALPSIAAVAQIDMRTMRREDAMGCRICISESQFESLEPAATVPGTNIMVKNLFFHMPARRKFLKKDSVELGHILREFERLALVNTDVDFTLIHNDVTLHQFLRGTLKQRISDLFGKSLPAQLAAVNTDTSLVRISGFVALPSQARKRGWQQFFFVNGRNMRHPFFHKAVMSCYERLIPADTQPSYFIDFRVDPATIDVNIHPQKHEIKFENEQAVWQILTAAIKETLGKAQASGALDFDMADAPDIPIFDPTAEGGTAAPETDADPGYNPFAESPSPAHETGGQGAGGGYRPRTQAAPTHDWEKLYENFSRRREESFAEMRSSALNSQPEDAGQTPALFHTDDSTRASATTASIQVRGSFIAAPSASGLMLIDQHRAHVRILYERFVESLKAGPIPTQRLIFPETLQLSPTQSAVLDTIGDTVAALGFDISFLGNGTWALNGQPALPGSASPSRTLEAIIDTALNTEGLEELATEDLLHPLALAMARAAAIRHGRTLTPQEMDALVADLFRTASPDMTPDGLPVIATLDHDTLLSFFR